MRPFLLSVALAVILPAAATAAPKPVIGPAKAAPTPKPTTQAVSALKASDGARTFKVSVRGRASTVVVCDVAPVVCRFAKRTGRTTWEASLPSGPVTPAVPLGGEPTVTLPPVAEAGAGPTYRVAVYTFRRSSPIRRDFGGRYLGA